MSLYFIPRPSLPFRTYPIIASSTHSLTTVILAFLWQARLPYTYRIPLNWSSSFPPSRHACSGHVPFAPPSIVRMRTFRTLSFLVYLMRSPCSSKADLPPRGYAGEASFRGFVHCGPQILFSLPSHHTTWTSWKSISRASEGTIIHILNPTS